MRRFHNIIIVSVAVLSIALVTAAVHYQKIAGAGAAHAQEAPQSAARAATVATTEKDYFLPGTQPRNLEHVLVDANNCATCHANYASRTGQAAETETWRAWSGSMMAQAGRDPLFFAALDIANADAANAGEFCLRCHLPSGWLEGRSSAPDGSAMIAKDQEGVQCSVCHRMLDPVSSAENPDRDAAILAALEPPVQTVASGSMIVDPRDHRRGPFNIVADLGGLDPHLAMGAEETLISPYHQEAIFCGTCHDINNPLFTWSEETQSYEPNSLDTPGDPAAGFPIERTYSEWRMSAFNSPEGVYAPEFGGNKSRVATCQDCHMRDTTGAAGAMGSSFVIRDNMPLHDLTGGNTWVPQIIPLHPAYKDLFEAEPARAEALAAGIERARAMLENAADLDVYRQGSELYVRVTNMSGHKLPTGYIEGRRMWLQVEAYDAQDNLVFTSGAYDDATGILSGYPDDPQLRVYEAKHGLTEAWASELGKEAGPTFHFALNNEIVSDNRIPPRGYTFDGFNAVQAAPYKNGAPDPDRYADGQFWDTAVYPLPPDAVRGEVRLLYQTASREYVEFLRDNNPNEGYNNGDMLYDLWEASNRSRPEVMAAQSFGSETARLFLPTVRRP